MPSRYCFAFAAVVLSVGTGAAQPSTNAGLFEGHGDIGDNPKAGSFAYVPASGEYRVTGGGANVWAASDAFQFVWKRISGDVTITADVQFVGAGAVAHRKAMLMVRQNLNADSPYADAALHGDGLTALQYRAAAAAVTQEVRSPLTAPMRIRLERRGNQFTLSAGQPGGELTRTEAVSLPLQDPVYAGIGVCSHDGNILETAVFSNVRIVSSANQQAQPRPPQQRYRSRITILDLKTKEQKVLLQADEIWEAPNWTVDGKFLLANSGGNLYRIAVDGTGKPEKLDVGEGVRCNNDHGFTHDGKLLAFSASSQGSGGSQVYVVAADGTGRRAMTTKAPSYFHGWSPDGKWLSIVANRTGNFDLFRIPVEGGAEQQLTSNPGYDDGPDYSPDGHWIYFNSNRAGNYDVWRIPADGAGPGDAKAEQVTSDEWEDWFPHPSPDGKRLVFISFPKGTADHNGKMDVALRMIPLPGKKVGKAQPEIVLKIFGGQGTINVNSWAPDSKRFAFVTYELLRP
ncbi:MAG: TolB family protein [Bryobacteraceae bacterium]